MHHKIMQKGSNIRERVLEREGERETNKWAQIWWNMLNVAHRIRWHSSMPHLVCHI